MQVWHGNENQIDKFDANIAAVLTSTPKLKEKEREAVPDLPRYFNSHAKSRNIERGGSGADNNNDGDGARRTDRYTRAARTRTYGNGIPAHCDGQLHSHRCGNDSADKRARLAH